ncbi:mucin-2 [Engraulis encrasicolus]|uniref:mucin-2 n=1 Tax=Engraulis encrasicolus TaxID=184585 RepID=UPI002FD2202D
MSYKTGMSPVPGSKKRVLKDSSWIKKDSDDDVFGGDEDKGLGYKTGSVSNLTKRFGGSQDLLDKTSKPTSPGTKTSTTTSTSSVTKTTTETKTSSSGTSKPVLPSKPSSPGGTSFTDRVFSANKPSYQRYSSPAKVTTPTTPTTPTKDTTNGFQKHSTTTTTKTTTVVETSPNKETTTKTRSTTSYSLEDPPSSRLRINKSSTLDNLADTLIDTPTKPAVSSPERATTKSNTLDNLSDTLLPTKYQKEMSVDSNPRSTYSKTLETSVDSPAERNTLDSLADTLNPFGTRTPTPPPPSPPPPPAPAKSLASPLDNLSDSLLYSPPKYTKDSSDFSYSDSSLYSPKDTYISSRTSQSVNSPSRRKSVSDKHLCSYCHQPIADDTRMVVDELHISSHADCFKCAVCHRNLGNLEAGDSLWVYRETVNCENCYSKQKDRWFHGI